MLRIHDKHGETCEDLVRGDADKDCEQVFIVT